MDENEGCLAVLAVFILLVVAFFAGCDYGGSKVRDDAYKQGQVDAMDGKWKWVRVKDADGHEYVVEKH